MHARSTAHAPRHDEERRSTTEAAPDRGAEVTAAHAAITPEERTLLIGREAAERTTQEERRRVWEAWMRGERTPVPPWLSRYVEARYIPPRFPASGVQVWVLATRKLGTMILTVNDLMADAIPRIRAATDDP